MPDPIALPPLFILRHGETEWNREGRFQGHLDSPLTDLGRRQAAEQAKILAGCLPEGTVARISTSGRAQATAEIALAGLAVPRTDDPRLRELALGAWQGMTKSEIADRGGVSLAPDTGDEPDLLGWQFTAPDGESIGEFTARISAVLAEITGPTVLITHGITSRVIRCMALGLDPDQLWSLPGGQGIVHRVQAGRADILNS